MDNYKHRLRKALIVSLLFTVAVIVAAALIYYRHPDMLIPVCVIAAAVLLVNGAWLLVSSRLTLEDIFSDVKGELNASLLASVLNNPYPVCMIDQTGTILWCNETFEELFQREEGMVNRKIFDLTGLKMNRMTHSELSERVVWISSIKKFFRVRATEYAADVTGPDGTPPADLQDMNLRPLHQEEQLPEANEVRDYQFRMLHWLDVTEYEQLKKTHAEERSCVIHIRLDNLDDILEQAPDDRKAALSGEIEKLIRQWAIKTRGALVRVSKMKFVLICDYRNLDITMQNKFPILDEVRELPTGGDIPASLSIGAGAGGKTLAQSNEFALAALDLALGRGGDQAVVSTESNTEYFGGKQLAGGKRNKGRSKTVSAALLQLIDQSEKVFIMGHRIPDMDAFGAAVGVARMVRSRQKTAYIIVNTSKAIETPYKLAQESGEYNIIKSEQAVSTATADDLVIMVDTHRPSLADCAELLDISHRIVIIDHHRKNPDIVKNPMLLHLEPYASSASELVTEMLQYALNGKKPLSDLEASLLLSGIVLDTRDFSIKTGVLTFDSASWLKRQGANTIQVRRFFQTNISQFREKAKIISGIERLDGDMVMGFLRKPNSDVAVLISSVANQLLEIRGLKASFVLGQEQDGTVRVSARSLGQVNVQLIMEKIGGGGNLTMAGAQLKTGFDEAVVIVKNAIDEYLQDVEEAKLKEQRQKELKKTRELKEKAKEKDK
ncbi:MAG: DHH family phosphoesterase [Firmicutes bacterium]|nr:DHH family phosphoesterase [Bacillota bacterium]